MCAATCYLKFNHPKEFYLSLLNLTKDESNPTEEVSKIQSEMTYFNLKLLQPDIILSDLDFKIDGNNIRMGIGNIKGIAQKTIEKIKAFRHDYSSKFDIFNAANETKLGIGVLSALIQSGCLGGYCQDIPRSRLVLEAQLYNILTPKEKKRVIDLGGEFKYDLIEIIKNLNKIQEGASKSFIKDSRMETIRNKFKGYQEIFKLNSRNEKLACYWYEITLLGFSYSYKLADIIKDEYPDSVDISSIKEKSENDRIRIGGRIVEIKRGVGKTSKKKYLTCFINDSTGEYKTQISERDLEKNEQLNHNIPLAIGDIVVAEGRIGKDIIWADRIVSQQIKIYSKLSELKNKEKLEEKEK